MRSAKSAREEATDRSSKIFTLYETLHAIIQRHEATLQKRWAKKTRQQRLRVLLNAWPDMATTHRPDFDCFWRQQNTERDIGRDDYFLWPYINQEDLSDTRRLLLLLNARGRHPPSYFAAADNDAMHLGIVTGAIVPCFLNEYTMIMNGMTDNSHEYGKLVSWDDEPDAFDWLHTQKQPQPGDGLLVLSAQERLLEFLVDCCKEILHEITLSDMTTAFPIVPEPQLKHASEITGFDSLAARVAEALYQVPAKLDFELVKGLLDALASATEDHVWHLREDPGYFAAEILGRKERMDEVDRYMRSLGGPPNSRRKSSIWAEIVPILLADSYLYLEIYSELAQQADRLVALQKQYADVISPLEDLPKDFHEALLVFQYFLYRAAKVPIARLKNAILSSPSVREFYLDEMRFYEGYPDMGYTGTKPNDAQKKFIWIIHTLSEDGNDLFLTSLPLIMDELDRLMDKERSARDLLTPYLMKMLGDLSILAQCSRQLGLYKPWFQTFETDIADRKDEFNAEYYRRGEPMKKILDGLNDNALRRAVELANPTGGKFAYPIERRRSEQNVEALRSAEENLDAFWADVDRVMVAKGAGLRGTALGNLFEQGRILQRTPEYVPREKAPEPAASTPDQDQNQVNRDAHLYASYQPISRIYSGISGHSLATKEPAAKIKTRGQPQHSTADNSLTTPLSNPSLQSDEQPTFAVDARAHKVFRSLFFNPNLNSTPGEVPWNDFLHAMTSVGFTVMKLYGSVWQFTPTKLNVERKIQFHEPHPKPKLAFNVARQFGRRLNRAYGWFGEMFVLAEK
ncbi:hypothetical protein BDW74DRAFT_164223 [Aspergillus multicolor]|uniref:uncharacterized protein n=1 Tax=Aspergillus multicolor TaxID=41759 RepID=UPI003CCDDEA9